MGEIRPGQEHYEEILNYASLRIGHLAHLRCSIANLELGLRRLTNHQA